MLYIFYLNVFFYMQVIGTYLKWTMKKEKGAKVSSNTPLGKYMAR